jgi:GGDEF domain-containing protein
MLREALPTLIHSPAIRFFSQPFFLHFLGPGLAVAALVFAAAVFGGLTRSAGFLSSLWPANALLIALMVRKPDLSGPAGWLGAVVGYMTADLAMGGGLLLTTWLTSANMANAMLCVALFQRIDIEDRQLRRPAAIIRLLAICICGAVVATAVGLGALVEFFGADPINATGSYFASELGNGLIVLPMALSAPSIGAFPCWYRRAEDSWGPRNARAAVPALVLFAALLLGEIIEGPARVVLFVPAIIWCALSYKLFTTACLMFVVGLWHLILLAPDVHSGQNAFFHSIISVRLAFGFLALGPMSIALTRSAQNDLVESLKKAASQDVMTGALSRSAFLEKAGQVLARKATERPLEFAVLLPEIAPANAMIVAERIRLACEKIVVTSDAGEIVRVSVSVGVACAAATQRDVGDLLKAADQALYAAKRTGRNRVAQWTP